MAKKKVENMIISNQNLYINWEADTIENRNALQLI